MLWNLFCRVIDNHGDVGVCWRLAADLAARGELVRLVIDDASALRWMAPDVAPGVEVVGWPKPAEQFDTGDVVIEAFGCELPETVLRSMAAASTEPVWINLEYLSAEAFSERAHRLASPQSAGPGEGLRKWFFYPGFTTATGGLLREPDLMSRQASFDPASWLSAHGLARRDDEHIVSLFCYAQPALPALMNRLAQRPTLLLATTGEAAQQIESLLGADRQHGDMRWAVLPRLTQPDYDHLLWSSDLNLVRGEDSFVRAQWAGKPFMWQIYPQRDGVHVGKLDAFLARFLAGAESGLAASCRTWFETWNGVGFHPHEWPPLPASGPWRRHVEQWRASLLTQADLTSQLLGFVAVSR